MTWIVYEVSWTKTFLLKIPDRFSWPASPPWSSIERQCRETGARKHELHRRWTPPVRGGFSANRAGLESLLEAQRIAFAQNPPRPECRL